MNIAKMVALASSGILAAGCAHEETHAQYDEGVTPAAGQSRQYDSSQYISHQYGTATESDKALADQVRQSLQRDPQIAPVVPNIQITADKGMVILAGTVQSGEQKRKIQSIVEDILDVAILDDQLRVSSGAMTPTSNDTNSSPRIYHDAGSSTNGSVNNP